MNKRRKLNTCEKQTSSGGYYKHQKSDEGKFSKDEEWYDKRRKVDAREGMTLRGERWYCGVHINPPDHSQWHRAYIENRLANIDWAHPCFLQTRRDVLLQVVLPYLWSLAKTACRWGVALAAAYWTASFTLGLLIWHEGHVDSVRTARFLRHNYECYLDRKLGPCSPNPVWCPRSGPTRLETEAELRWLQDKFGAPPPQHCCFGADEELRGKESARKPLWKHCKHPVQGKGMCSQMGKFWPEPMQWEKFRDDYINRTITQKRMRNIAPRAAEELVWYVNNLVEKEVVDVKTLGYSGSRVDLLENYTWADGFKSGWHMVAETLKANFQAHRSTATPRRRRVIVFKPEEEQSKNDTEPPVLQPNFTRTMTNYTMYMDFAWAAQRAPLVARTTPAARQAAPVTKQAEPLTGEPIVVRHARIWDTWSSTAWGTWSSTTEPPERKREERKDLRKEYLLRRINELESELAELRLELSTL